LIRFSFPALRGRRFSERGSTRKAVRAGRLLT
jgi:hypothetical protein